MKNVIFKMTSLHLQKMGSGMKIALIAICLTLTAPLHGQRYGNMNSKSSTVTIESWDDRDFILEIDGRRYQADGSITLRNIRPGTKSIRVYRKQNRNSNHLRNNRGRGVVLYTGTLDIPRNSRVRARVSKRKSLRILNITRLNGNRPSGNRPSGNGSPSCGTSTSSNSNYGHMGAYDDEFYGTHHNEENYYEDVHGFEPYSVEDHNYYGGCSVMSHHEFDRLIENLECAPFSSDKKRISTQALRHNHITTEQLVGILMTFSFDKDRLAVAKSAYEKVVDKENSWEIYEAFTFSSTSRQFENFISDCR